MKRSANLPSEADFQRAAAQVKGRSQGLERACGIVMDQSQPDEKLHALYIFPEAEAGFRAFVIFETEADLKAAQDSNLFQELEGRVKAALKSVGREFVEPLCFEFDSQENVRLKYGNELNRLR